MTSLWPPAKARSERNRIGRTEYRGFGPDWNTNLQIMESDIDEVRLRCDDGKIVGDYKVGSGVPMTSWHMRDGTTHDALVETSHGHMTILAIRHPMPMVSPIAVQIMKNVLPNAKQLLADFDVHVQLSSARRSDYFDTEERFGYSVTDGVLKVAILQRQAGVTFHSGSMIATDTDIPDTAMTGSVGMDLARLVEHPYILPGLAFVKRVSRETDGIRIEYDETPMSITEAIASIQTA